jgi:hypothetical protein
MAQTLMRSDYTVPIDTMNPYALKAVIEEVIGVRRFSFFPKGA